MLAEALHAPEYDAERLCGGPMNLKVLYQTPVLKLMNILVFVDSFILISIGVGLQGNQGLAFGAVYGLLGGITAVLAFNMVVVAMIIMNTRTQSKA
jgi:hypothetical protein